MSASDSPPSIPSDAAKPTAGDTSPQLPQLSPLRTHSDTGAEVAHPLSAFNAARRPFISSSPVSSPAVPTSASSTMKAELPRDTKEMQAILKAFHQKRQHSMTGNITPTLSTSPGGAFIGGAGFTPIASPRMTRPNAPNWQSSPAAPSPPTKQSLGLRRGLKLPGGLPGAATASPVSAGGAGSTNGDPAAGSLFNKFSNYVDTTTGSLKFAGKAVIHGKGVDFSSGSTFRISLDELESLDELGKGNYGTVYKVIHRKPRVRVPGAGVAKHPSDDQQQSSDDDHLTGVVMAMKEIRLELDEAKFAAIIMELDILHRCVSPYIIDFYGAFFQEGAVYICIEWMDGGSMDKLYGDGVPENVLRKVTWATIKGLKYLKEEHNIIHRDVKPTNILVNTKGDVKLCDFGVSGNLVASIAKTNIGCQSYMAPERIATGGVAQAGVTKDGTYSVQSDVWSLGLSILECAMGRYPYPPETYNNIFSQLSAIVDGPPPDLPEEGFSPQARDFVRRTLHKIPKMRPTYAALLQHPWLADMQPTQTITEEEEDEEAEAAAPKPVEQPLTSGFPEVRDWVVEQLKKRDDRLREGGQWGGVKPALHSVALDKVVSPTRETPMGGDGEDSLADGLEGLTVNS
ncbi:PAK-2p27 [Drechslerella dactyloides]|uniref:mitogen-activated protein kinase kinase n=1 Tax=Drechslerella dactyloides TaxID=74499 RepID=A0AAD6J3C6_DREDA|nr:PAK-2p27 [Drechslerella dactyloides]